MKISKEQIGNGIWILAIILILFTPVGFHLRVFVGKLFSTSATVIKVEERKMLKNYDWDLVDLNGQRFNFESYKGEVVVVNLWATWCPPCVAELPSLVALHQDYKDEVVFAFVANDKKGKVNSFLKKKNYEIPVFFEASKTPELLVSKSIPATYVISKTGKVVIAEQGVADWNSRSTRDLLNKLILE
ncbi:thiol-disulfide oxidoreductase [Flagellimonas aquimarina]|uniref:Thiol-disulfide oxidoreductase n=1 Tax=Flagellimonas aquimarina TaxID=2201895 RepID=A0A316KUM8_9FLAO|nr:TlpA disulfide reductase family protein [Allomuricauda koreensis]PWL37346.1 thiol-disulfide oxidoreductase [Allomuricauda koreensis]